ncbi:UPF0182 family protein [Leptolyngbya ohadii]|uniref:UPF0182 family protein n=1 Tax=Leptolyngbya ohadii TaxID=1962290 RepID=UPI000B59F1CF|nr:UPF0182 family protein [Leptolyngbya ohadii]
MVQTKPARFNFLRLIAAIVAFLLAIDLLTFLLGEWFWFQEVDYPSVFRARLTTQVLLGLLTVGITLWVWLSQWRRAQGHAKAVPDGGEFWHGMGMARLLPLVLLLSLTIALLAANYGQAMLQHWRPRLLADVVGNAVSYRPPPIPASFRPQVVTEWGQQILSLQAGGRWLGGIVGGLLVGLLVLPQFFLGAIAVSLSLGFGLVMSEQWTTILAGLNSTPFNQTDPIFNRDLSFYIFRLPIWQLLQFWLVGLSVLIFCSVLLVYLRSNDSLSRGEFSGFTQAQRQHLYRLGGFWLLTVALSYWLDRYRLLFSPLGIVYGASFTNVRVDLPVYTVLSLAALLLAIGSLVIGFGGRQKGRNGNRNRPNVRKTSANRSTRPQSVTRSSTRSSSPNGFEFSNIGYPTAAASTVNRSTRRPIFRSQTSQVSQSSEPWLRFTSVTALIGFGVAAAIGGGVLPFVVQRLIVQPNELQLEQPYLARAIALTREAFDLSKIDVETFNPELTLTAEDIQRNDLTIDNIRLWDTRPLLETNRQLQRIRPYYEFPSADIDRYTLLNEDSTVTQQQVLIAARELDFNAVPQAAKTWVNEHLVYTHGYGFTVSPVNQVGEGGLPEYYIQGIPGTPSNDRIASSIPVGKPRIYFGEMTEPYVMTPTNTPELDYPSGSENVYNLYDGRGGVAIGQEWQRLLFAFYLRDWRILFNSDLTPDTRLMFRRTVQERIQTIAPFLQFDSNPYLVVADVGNKQWERGATRPTAGRAAPAPDEAYLYWMIDAYTISDRFPYSDPLGNSFNYVRNSVKILVDAYHGSVNFYVTDPDDPIIRTWQKVFPNMFQPLSEMPVALQRHIRYPVDLFKVQSNHLMTFHMTDPVVFYNREDLWRAPNEIYGNQTQRVDPYYLITKLPIGQSEEFILLLPFTPAQRNNLIAWMAARSDGEQYGRMLLYVFPKQELIFGPEQIEARINQDPVISQQIALWNREGSRAAQGNLLVIPIEQSLLYVEPLYLEAEQNQLPTLVRVIVAFANRIAMTETLEQSLTAIFKPPAAAPPIVRSVEDGALPVE